MIVLFATCALLCGPGDHDSGDHWFGTDKLKHFFASAFVQSVSYSAARWARADNRTALVLASMSSAAVGVGKEVLDSRTPSGFSVKDLTWDAAGAATASLVLARTR